jgi:four helix bundle protein
MMNPVEVYPPPVPEVAAVSWVAGKRGSNLLADKTMDFGLAVIRLYSALPNTAPAQVMGRQLLRCGTSIGAQYREACRARSDAEFISKLESSLQEVEESIYWLDLLDRSSNAEQMLLKPIRDLAEELVRLIVASVRTVKQRIGRNGAAKQ